MRFASRRLTRFPGETGGKNLLLPAGEEKGTTLKHSRALGSPDDSCPHEKLVNRSRTDLGEGKHPTPAHSGHHVSFKGGEKNKTQETLEEFAVQRHRLTKG